MDYSNPMSMFQNVNSVPNNPFWSGMMGQRNQANALPFMEQSFQDRGLDLQRKEMEVGEFASPLGQRSRATGLEHGIATKRAEMDVLPWKTNFEKKKYEEELRALPHMTDERIEKARSTIAGLKSQPHRELLSELGNAYDLIKDLPDENSKAIAYQSIIGRHRMLRPDIDIPENLRIYRPNVTLPELGLIRHAQLFTPEQVGKERLEHVKGGYGLQKEGLEQAGAKTRAEIMAGAQRYSADKGAERAAASETPAKAKARLMREIRTNPNNQEAKDELSGYLMDEFPRWLQHHPEKSGLDILQMQGMSDDAARVKYLNKLQEVQTEFYKEHGIDRPQYEFRVKDGKVQRKLKGKK